MATAALLRCVARKLARAPRPHSLTHGLCDGARSGPGSLPPPSKIQQGMGDRLVVGMAAATGLRSGAGLPPSLARKIARAPSQGYHRLLHERGLQSSTSPNPGASGSTPPPTNDKDTIENLRIRLKFTKFLASVAGTVVVYLYFWALPEAKAQAYSTRKSSNRDDDLTHAIKKLESILIEDAEIMQSSGHGLCSLELHGGTRVDKSEVDQVLKAFPVTKEIADGIKDIHIQANVNATEVTIKDRQTAAAAELTAALESALSEGERKE